MSGSKYHPIANTPVGELRDEVRCVIMCIECALERFNTLRAVRHFSGAHALIARRHTPLRWCDLAKHFAVLPAVRFMIIHDLN